MCPLLSCVSPESFAAAQLELFSWIALCSVPTKEPLVCFSFLSGLQFLNSAICCEWNLLRLGRPDCSILARFCVWEELWCRTGPLNAAAATASRVWSKESGWSWTELASETALVGTRLGSLVSEKLQVAAVAKERKHPGESLAASLSPLLFWLPSLYSALSRGFLPMNKRHGDS